MTLDFLFETSWEVCNKVGGIHTVISTKAKILESEMNDNFILIGPDLTKGKHENSEFTEDEHLYKSWKIYARSKGLSIRIGRWNIVGKPIVVLIDFTPFYNKKDKILYDLWNYYKVNSESGGWDYIEPVLFGYAAAKLIESYYEYYLSASDKVGAHFHEWMTASGILYLKKACPQIATVFTTHASVLGRCIAGNNLPLYNNMAQYDPDTVAANFGIQAKQSMESIAAREADAFSVVSETTNKECAFFLKKSADVVTPNGFEDDFVPKGDDFTEKRALARKTILSVAEALINQELGDDTMLIINSGRYEFRNKGIDVFIDALGQLNTKKTKRKTLAVIAVPAAHTSPNTQMLDRLRDKNYSEPIENDYISHYLHDYDNDPIIQHLKKNKLNNSPSDSVIVMFIPSYLNGDDGVFNISYFDLLIGFDGSVFPSYYEPWGYTPMESLAFHIPSITTSLAGFGQWIQEEVGSPDSLLSVLQRTDNNEASLAKKINDCLLQGLGMSDSESENLREKSYLLSQKTQWKDFIQYYHAIYDKALSQSSLRYALYSQKTPNSLTKPVDIQWGSKPEWKKILIKPFFPKALQDLVRISNNLWWSWNPEAIDLFRSINSKKFALSNENPISFLSSLAIEDLDGLMKDSNFIDRLERLSKQFDSYMEEAKEKPKDLIAYFSMEFGLHDSLKIFSGGLGMLAGDYLKEASDSNKNMIGIGLLYRYGYFTQQISKSGEQISAYVPQKFSQLPLQLVKDSNGSTLKISIDFPGRRIYAKIWQCEVGRIPLYLLDTDIEENEAEDCTISGQLYGGNWENRLKQEMLLGIGGIRLIEKLGLSPSVFHNNEGHSAFSCLERTANLMNTKHLCFDEAIEVIRSSTLFTTHTPVPAGHDTFEENLLRMYLSHYADLFNLSWSEFMGLGRFDKQNKDEKFSMSILATNFSQEVNGVSAIHGKVSREMFAGLYPGYFPQEIHIGHVTNGVHFPTWTAKSWRALYEKTFGAGFLKDQSNENHWEKIYQVEDQTIWKHHYQQKEQLFEEISSRLQKEFKARGESPNLWFKTMDNLSKDALTIGFARRFATYKRAHLLFSNLDKLRSLIHHSEKPVQFIFAGKAHPNDKAGQDLIKRIIEISKMPDFIGKILFLENYDMRLAKFLIRGVDVWLNTPTRPLEASGTSGEKAIMNGVLNLSVLDGWWAEGWKEGAGWALSEEAFYENDELQNTMDAETIYELLESEIVPLYYRRNKEGFSPDWVLHIKNTIAQIAPHFTMKRQLDDYYDHFYQPLITRNEELTKNDFQKAKEMSQWKNFILKEWNNIELLRLSYPNLSDKAITLGSYYHAEIVLQLNKIPAENIGVEMVVTEKVNSEHRLLRIHTLELLEEKNGRAVYSLHSEATSSGIYEYAFRIYPQHHLLPHRQDFALLKWI